MIIVLVDSACANVAKHHPLFVPTDYIPYMPNGVGLARNQGWEWVW